MPEEEFIINVHCLIDDLYKELFPSPIRTRGYEPKLSDSEVIAIEIGCGSFDTTSKASKNRLSGERNQRKRGCLMVI